MPLNLNLDLNLDLNLILPAHPFPKIPYLPTQTKISRMLTGQLRNEVDKLWETFWT
ncbi:MAG: hypothetical protein GVY26_01535, partial [Bacteroidetes bacterium]|nr:hypothetical protein [Bacteroidota bacterium]